MKKIVITANTSWYLFNFRANTILSLVEAGYLVVAVAPDKLYGEKLAQLGCCFHTCYLEKSSKNPIKDFIALASYISVYRTVRPSIVLNFTPKVNIYSTFAAKFVGVKVINNVAGLGLLFVQKNLLTHISFFLYRLSQPLADHIFFQNDEDMEVFQKKGLLGKSGYSRIPGSGVDLNRFVPKQAPDDGVVRFILVARMIVEKGIYQFIEAARKVKENFFQSEFYLLGEIDINNISAISLSEVQAWEAEGLVTYLGKTDNVAEILEGMDCVILPSFYREGVPRVLLEAAAMAKPIITTDNVGCRETLINGKTGYICKPRSADDLAEKMLLMVEDGHKKRLMMGYEGRHFIASKFDEELVVQSYLKLISEVSEGGDSERKL